MPKPAAPIADASPEQPLVNSEPPEEDDDEDDAEDEEDDEEAGESYVKSECTKLAS